jgi:hypothetical protein
LEGKDKPKSQFGILQDRLVKELRLAGAKTKEEANKFLEGYLPVYNKKFEVSPANDTDVHVKPPRGYDLDKHLCIKSRRTVGNDNTVACNGKFYQIETTLTARKVTVEERFDGHIRITCNGKNLKYRHIKDRPFKVAKKESKRPYHHAIPAKDHPWRRLPKPMDNRRVWANAD